MARLSGKRRDWAVAGAAAVGIALLLLVSPSGRTEAAAAEGAMATRAQGGSITVPLAAAMPEIHVSEAKVPGRPIVVIDPGHGGHDPGALAVSTTITEKQLTLALATELRDRLVERGRVRVAMTRETDRYLSLDQRAAIARRLDASLFLSVHMDSAPNPLARGATVYSLSDVASDPEAARFAAAENAGSNPSGKADDIVDTILTDLALRNQMTASADLSTRLLRRAAGRFELRPEARRFAAFHVLRQAEVPAILFEAGYISNADDELLLRSPEYRAKIVRTLAEAIEADVAYRNRR